MIKKNFCFIMKMLSFKNLRTWKLTKYKFKKSNLIFLFLKYSFNIVRHSEKTRWKIQKIYIDIYEKTLRQSYRSSYSTNIIHVCRWKNNMLLSRIAIQIIDQSNIPWTVWSEYIWVLIDYKKKMVCW